MSKQKGSKIEANHINKMQHNQKPFVSVVTPTYNRRKFIPTIIELYKAQTYPKDRMEWIIYDDGTDSVRDLFDEASKTIPNIRYFYLPNKVNIGAKRNWLNDAAKGDIILSIDDDDYQFPERISHTVSAMSRYPNVNLAGSSEVYMYYTDNGTFYKFGPYMPNHETNNTLAVRKIYAKTHKYDETVVNGEEKSFLEGYKHPLIQLDSLKVILAISHLENTFNKAKFREQESKFVVKSALKLRDLIRDKKTRDFFSSGC